MSRARWLLLLVAASFAARAPALLHPETTNSDCAVVGLQAMHVLRGELSPLLWGSAYQTSVDSLWTALFFAVSGPSPAALMLAALSLHVALTLAAFDLLARVLGELRAFVLALLLVCTGAAIHSYALYPPRQAALTAVFVGIALVARGAEAKRRADWWTGGGAALVAFAPFADPYALVMLPAAAGFVLLTLRASAPGGRARRAAAAALGAAAGLVPMLLLSRHPAWRAGEASLALRVVAKNVALLVSTCGPWAFGASVFRPTLVRDYALWAPPAALAWALRAGAVALVGAIFVAPAAAFVGRASPGARRLSLAGALMAYGTVAGFALSLMVMDHFSMRYLAAAVLAAPLSLAALAERLTPRQLLAVVAPALFSGLVSGWAALGPVVRGPTDWAALPGHPDEQALIADLVGRGVTHGVADYWVSYRLTFMSGERLVVAPSHAAQDRYLPYRRALGAAPSYAYIVDAHRSDEAADVVAARLASRGLRFERRTFGSMIAFIVGSPFRESD